MNTKLTSEESILLLTCRPYLSTSEDVRLGKYATIPSLDWAYILWRSQAYRTTSVLHYHLDRLQIIESLPNEVSEYLLAWKKIASAQLLTQYHELGFILTALEDAGVTCFLTKGAALGPRYYPSAITRSMQDVDLMIDPNDAQTAQEAMLAIGYQHGLWNPSNNQIDVQRYQITPDSLSKYHELPSLTKCVVMRSPVPRIAVPWTWRRKYIKCFIDDNDVLTIPVFVDIHVNLSAGIDLSDVWRGAEREDVLGRQVKVQSPTSMLWFIASRLYHEAFEYSTLKLIMFGDLQAIVHSRGDDIDWVEIVTIAKKYGMEPALFYVLSQLKNITGAAIPDPVLSFLCPGTRGIPSQHDWGDVMPKLLSIPLLHDIKMA